MVELFPVGTQKMWFVRLVVGLCFGDFLENTGVEVLLDV